MHRPSVVFPLPGLADEAKRFAFPDRKGHVVHRLDDRRRAPKPVLADEVFDEMAHIEEGRRSALVRGSRDLAHRAGRPTPAPGIAASRLRV